MPKTKPFDEHYKEYEKWFKLNKNAYLSELKAIQDFIPLYKKGMEVGIGSGLFALPLGIKDGVEPSENMRVLARSRGLNAIDGVAERLPYASNTYDFVLMVTTICFVDDVKISLFAIRRVLKQGGKLIVAFIDKDSPLGESYLKNKEDSLFYKDANFYSTNTILSLLNECGFKNPQIRQTVYGKLSDINEVQDFKDGYGEGSFIIISVEK